MNARILFAICGGFLAGVFARSFVSLGVSSTWFLALLALAVILASMGARQRRIGASVVSAALLACALGIWRMDASVLTGDPYLDARIGKEVTLEGVVAAELDVRQGSVRLAVEAQSASSTPIRAGVLAVLPPHTAVSYGDHVRVRGTLRLPEEFDTGLGRAFDYPGYLAARGIGYELARAQVEVLGPAECCSFIGSLTQIAIGVKHAYISGVRAALPEPQSGLAAGIVAGDKRGLGKEITEEFRTVSLTHIIVLSGYNITIVAYGLIWLLTWFSAPRWARIAGGAFVALFFALMTGGESASVRAAAMAAVAMSASAAHRIFDPARALALVATAMAAWNPFVVAFDPGFQLSVLAVAGLIRLAPIFEERLPWVSRQWGLREMCAATLGAQLAVLPLLLYQSGLFSLAALPANIAVLAFVPAAMAASALASIGGLVLGPLAPVFALPAYALLSYILYVPHLLAHVPYAAFALPAFGAWLLVPAYVLIFVVLPRFAHARSSQSGSTGMIR